MSTNGSIGFIINNEYKGTYNHYDSNPEVLGQQIVDFAKKLTEINGWSTFIQLAKQVKVVDRNNPAPKYLQKKYKKFSNISVGDHTLSDWYCLLNKIQGVETLEKIYSLELEHIIDNSNFIKNSLHCEYGYVLNLDDKTFEFYEGFQQEPQENNRFGQEGIEKFENMFFYPCKLVGKCNLLEIPDNWEKIFYENFDEDGNEIKLKNIETDISGVAKQYVLHSKNISRKTVEVKREIEKLENSLKELFALYDSSIGSLKEKINHIDEIKELSYDEFKVILFDKIRKNNLLI